MSRITFISVCLIISVLLVSTGCGPSAEELEAMAAATTAAAASPTPAPTNTPQPTATATPIPYDLSVEVFAVDGTGLEGVSVVLKELEAAENASILTDSAGMAAWANLPGESVSLEISFPGYFPAEQSQTLQRGSNEVKVTLERDPSGLLVTEACASGETPIYIEDFQDKLAQGWQEIMFNAQGWSIAADPGNEANMVAVAKQGAPWTWYDRENINLNNSVLRLRYKYNGNAVSHINFRFVEIPGMDARYMYVTGAYSHLQRINTGTTIGLANFPAVSPDTWHQLEMGYFNGVLSIYLDGKPLFENTDPEPWEGGTINLEPYPQNDSEMFLYDNISLCELSAPMETLFVEAP